MKGKRIICCHNDMGLRAKCRAFSILEVIVAMVILGVGMIAILAAMRSSANASHHSRMQTRAVLIAETQLVNTRLTDLTSYMTTQGQSKDGRFNWQVQIAPTSKENLGRVQVTVNWQEGHRKNNYDLISFAQMKSFEQTNP
ncbi:hypothetical protein LCGC14_1902470 [marine sediment metagenome]|uniref:Type II secretion system protein GspI C-terminal domain-containing protein n=1 Tax=marine sediment metagenome TaxID=412755 RepID=A0A0F9FW61_9ZZZZ